jgi:hypothetical protein
VNAPVLFLEVLFTPFEVTTTSAGLFAAAGRLPWWEIATGILTIPAGVATLIYTLVQIRKVWIETGVQKEKIENRVHEREVEPGREGSVDNGMIGKPGSHPPKSALPEGKMDIAELGRDRFLRGGTNGFFAHFEPGVVASCHSPQGRLPLFLGGSDHHVPPGLHHNPPRSSGSCDILSDDDSHPHLRRRLLTTSPVPFQRTGCVDPLHSSAAWRPRPTWGAFRHAQRRIIPQDPQAATRWLDPRRPVAGWTPRRGAPGL